MSDTLTEQSRGPDGRFAASNPDPTGTAPAAQAAPTEAAPEAAVTSAPKDTAREEARQVWDSLTKDATNADGGTTGSTPQPAASETTAAAAPAPATPAQAAAQPTEPAATAADATAKPYADYANTLDRRTGDLLKSVGMLPPPELWREMSPVEQVQHVAACRQLRNQNNAAFQRQQRNSGQTDDRSDARGGQPEFSGQAEPTAPPIAAPQGANGQRVQLPPLIEQHLAEVAQAYGVDDPVYKAQRAMAEAQANQFQQVQTATNADRQRQQGEQRMRSFEDTAFGEFAHQADVTIPPGEMEALRAQCRAYYKANHDIGNDIGDREAVEFVLRSRFLPEISRRESQKRETARTKSLAGSVERGTPAASKPAPTDPKAAAKEQYERLQSLQTQGIDGPAALAQLSY